MPIGARRDKRTQKRRRALYHPRLLVVFIGFENHRRGVVWVHRRVRFVHDFWVKERERERSIYLTATRTTLGGKGEGEKSDDDGKPQTMLLLQFGGWSSAVDPSFWHKIAELKLNRMHLSEKEIECESEFHMSRNDGVDVPMFVNGANVLADEDDANGVVARTTRTTALLDVGALEATR